MDYRPYPLSQRPWIMHQRWHDLLFAHWPVSLDALRSAIPPSLEIDTFDGQAWIGVVPFWMSNVRPRYLPAVPGLSRFPELNVRTYVTHQQKPGVFFFSLDAANPLAVRIARTFYHLPYFNARMAIDGGTWNGNRPTSPTDPHALISYSSDRTHLNTPPAALKIFYRPTSEAAAPASPGTLPYWLTARYCLYTSNSLGHLYCGEIHHDPWPLQPAEAQIQINTMAEAAGISLPEIAPILHFSRRLDVQIWPLQACLACHEPSSPRNGS